MFRGAAILSGALLIGSVAVAEPLDPGVRPGAPGAGGFIAGLSNQILHFLQDAAGAFSETDSVANGLGPRFNLNSCVGCHAFPATGGSSPATNPQIDVARVGGATNAIPPFITLHGPIREARFVSDGGVHGLFTITGRTDAPGCHISQPDFTNTDDIIFRIPTPTFGLGLVQNTPDRNLKNDAAALGSRRAIFGINGRFNHSGNDGTITKFGWKAQNKSLSIFSGEAYNVEIGVTNELFPNERDDDPSCLFNATPEDRTNAGASGLSSKIVSDVQLFAQFMEFLAPPAPSTLTASVTRGQQSFDAVGCGLCHAPQHVTGRSEFAGLDRVTYNPYSDFQLHDMGDALQDRISQGEATGREFRTAPLWGIGQRIFFLHDGRTADLLRAITEHSSGGSEANAVVTRFNQLPDNSKQDIVNFLRGL